MTMWTERLGQDAAQEPARTHLAPMIGYAVAIVGSLAIWAVIGALVLRAL